MRRAAFQATASPTMKAVLRLLLRCLFRFRAFNLEALNTPGPVLLLPNHVSWIDWLFLFACAPGDWKCVVSRRTAQTSWLHRKIMLNPRSFPVDTDSPYAVKHMAEFLKKGGRLALFPEGRLSATGSLMRLYDGPGFLLLKTKARVILCHFRGTDRIPFSPNPNRKQFLPKVTAHFSEPIQAPEFPGERPARQRARLMEWLNGRTLDFRFQTELEQGPSNLAAAITAAARTHGNARALEDPNGSISRERLVLGSRLLASQLARQLDSSTPRTGLLLPNVNAAPAALLALWALGREAALLNFSTGPAQMLACARAAGLTQIVTSRAFLEKARLNLTPLTDAGLSLIFLEDVRAAIPAIAKLSAKLASVFSTSLGPLSRAAWSHLSPQQQADRTAVILFTSGSEGVPKGVQLSHRNLLANVRQLVAVTDLTETDKLFNAMPLFHSFGLTVGLLVPLLSGMPVYLYPSPLHFRIIPSAVYECDATILIATNTFLNGYARKAHPYDFRNLRCVFSAAEKLQEDTARTWARRFGVRILEGYGATECSPAISLNTGLAATFGSAGRFLPGISYRLEPVAGVPDGGRLFVSGPNVMKGYLTDAPDSSPDKERWYDTGDIVRVDDDGFLFIMGRLKRFAKIGGEMISLTAVEDALASAFPHLGPRCETAIIVTHDPERGEQLCTITTDPRLTADEIRTAIRNHGLPNLAVPRTLRVIPEIPRLGTGKVDYRELERRLLEKP